MESERAKLAVPLGSSLLDALGVIDRGVAGIAFVVDESGRMLGTITDGDIRRALLRHEPLRTLVDTVMNAAFHSMTAPASRDGALRLMTARAIQCVPVLDGDGRLLGAYRLNDLLHRTRRANSAVIMAGGRGTRLQPLTHAMPKPMLPIGDRPLLEHIVQQIVASGIRDIHISVLFMGRMIEDHFRDGSAFDCQIRYLREDEPLGSGGCLSLLPEKTQHPLVVMNGDVLTRLNFGRMIDFHSERGAYATMGVRSFGVDIPFGVVEISNASVVSLSEKPRVVHQVNTGIYVLSPEAVDSVPAAQQFPITRLFERGLSQKNLIAAYPIEDEWADIGAPSEYFARHLGS